jgi:hypothetical protein
MADKKASTTPTSVPKIDEPKTGFSTYSELLNGRAAMMGFVIALAIEYSTGQGALTWLGLITP